jgi:AraC-like DNA-binding protein
LSGEIETVDRLSQKPRELPFSLFTTANLRPRDQFDAWHQSISVIFDTEPLADRAVEQGFNASVRAYHLGALMVTRVDFDGQRFVRDRRKSLLDGLDHYLVQLYATGGLVGTAEGRERVLRGGDVQILDLSRANTTEAAASATIAVVIPRDTLRMALPGAGDLHGLVLRGDDGAGGLLADHMRSLLARADAITVPDAPAIAQATTDMIGACFHSTAETRARAQTAVELAMLDRIRRHIETNLKASTLDADSLCTVFRLSRTTLYRLFGPLGGVAAYIQERRLARAHVELANPALGHRHIYDIAYDCGFTNEAHFSRVFRRAFGMSPSDARVRPHLLMADANRLDLPEAMPGRAYEDWVRALSRR